MQYPLVFAAALFPIGRNVLGHYFTEIVAMVVAREGAVQYVAALILG